MPKKSESDESAFKNWINAEVVNNMARQIQFHYPDFANKKFQSVALELGPLELKARIQLIREKLQETLPQSYVKALKILLKAVLSPGHKSTPLKGFALWPFTDFIQTYGLNDIENSLEALEKITPYFTAEFAVRPFLNTHAVQTYAFLKNASKSKNDHVRRWSSEGSRPRLPWGEQLREAIKNPTRGLEILETLKTDESEYVRKSVANHLNDISKDHPELTLKIAKKWLSGSSKADLKNTTWIVRHGLRTLLKQGHPEALKIFGYQGKVQVLGFKLNSKKVKMGQSLEFSFQVKARAKTKVMVDYILHHQKSNGKTSPKVFKLTAKEINPGEFLGVTKKHSFKPITTRVYYPGVHSIEIMINGHRFTKVDFQLVR